MNLVDIDALAVSLNNLGVDSGFNGNQLAAFQKALTSTSGYTGYNLERDVKRFLQAYTVMARRVARDSGPVGPQGGTSARYKAQLGFGTFNFGASMGTPFGANGNDTNPNAVEIAADYKSQSTHGSVQLEAVDFGRQFTDPLQAQMMMNMAAISRLEEYLILGGNEAAIAAPASVTVTSGGTGTTFAAGTWTVKVTALTLQGALANNTAANTTPQVNSLGANITNSYMGESTPTTGSTVVSGTKQYLDVKWPIVKGACAYKVYVSAAYNDSVDVYLSDPATEMAPKDYPTSSGFSVGTPPLTFTGQKHVGALNHIRVIAAPGGSTPPPSVDGSACANQFEGMIAWCAKTTMYGTDLSSFGTKPELDQDGALLTSDTAGGVKEINSILQQLAIVYHTGPTAIVASPATVTSITARIASQSMMRLDLTQVQNRIVGGIMVGGYINRFAQAYGLKTDIDVIPHPYLPDGHILLLSETLPPDTYRFANDGRCFALDVLRPFNYFPLASIDRNVNFDVWFLETLKAHYPLPQATISGVRVDS